MVRWGLRSWEPKTIVHENARWGSKKPTEVNNTVRLALSLANALLIVPVREVKL
jgi:hypothetical protein